MIDWVAWYTRTPSRRDNIQLALHPTLSDIHSLTHSINQYVIKIINSQLSYSRPIVACHYIPARPSQRNSLSYLLISSAWSLSPSTLFSHLLIVLSSISFDCIPAHTVTGYRFSYPLTPPRRFIHPLPFLIYSSCFLPKVFVRGCRGRMCSYSTRLYVYHLWFIGCETDPITWMAVSVGVGTAYLVSCFLHCYCLWYLHALICTFNFVYASVRWVRMFALS